MVPCGLLKEPFSYLHAYYGLRIIRTSYGTYGANSPGKMDRMCVIFGNDSYALEMGEVARGQVGGSRALPSASLWPPWLGCARWCPALIGLLIGTTSEVRARPPFILAAASFASPRLPTPRFEAWLGSAKLGSLAPQICEAPGDFSATRQFRVLTSFCVSVLRTEVRCPPAT